MSFTRIENKGNAVFQMNNALTIYEAASIRDALLETLENNDTVEMDLRKVTKFDISGIQLIAAAKKTAEKKNKAFAVSGYSDIVAETAFRTGFEQYGLFNNGPEFRN